MRRDFGHVMKNMLIVGFQAKRLFGGDAIASFDLHDGMAILGRIVRIEPVIIDLELCHAASPLRLFLGCDDVLLQMNFCDLKGLQSRHVADVGSADAPIVEIGVVRFVAAVFLTVTTQDCAFST